MSTFAETFFKNFIFLVFSLFILFSQPSCTLNANISELNPTAIQNPVSLKVQGNITQVDVTEGSTLVMIITQSAALSTDSQIKLTIEELGFPLSSSFNDSFPITQVLKAGETAVTVSFATKHDPSLTGNKIFRLLVSSANSNILGTQLDLNIIDLEKDQPTLSINNVTVTEGQQALISFSLNQPAPQDITLNYATVDGTAGSGVH